MDVDQVVGERDVGGQHDVGAVRRDGGDVFELSELPLRAALFAHAQTRVLQLLGRGIELNHARIGVEEHALVVGGAFAQPRHAHERRDFEAVRQNRRVTRHAPFFEHETDDVEVVAFTQLKHVGRVEAVAHEDHLVLDRFDVEEARLAAPAGERALHALHDVRDVLDALTEVVVVDLLEVAAHALQTQRERPFGVDELRLDEFVRIGEKRRVLEDGAVDFDEGRGFRREVFVERVRHRRHLLVDGAHGVPQAQDFTADLALFDRELRDVEVGRSEDLHRPGRYAGVDRQAVQLYGGLGLFLEFLGHADLLIRIRRNALRRARRCGASPPFRRGLRS